MGYEELLNALMNLSVRDAVDTGKKGVRGAAAIGKSARTGAKLGGKVLTTPLEAGKYLAGQREASDRAERITAGMRAGQRAGGRAAVDPYGTGKAMYDTVTNLPGGAGRAFKPMIDNAIDRVQGQGGRATEPPIEMNPYLNNMNTAPMPGSVGQQGDYNMDLKYRGKPQTPQIVGGGSTLAPANLRGAASGGFGGEGGAAGMGVQGIRDINQMSPEEEELMRAIIAQRMMAAQGANLVGQPATAPRYTG